MTSPIAFTSSPFPPLNAPQEIYEISFANNTLLSEEDSNTSNYAYKKVANRTYPVATTLPENFHIVHRIPTNPLENMPELPTHPPDFIPGI
jgi:hypothetical protein